MRWKAKRFGADPHKVAGFIEMMVRNEVFENVNGLYVKCVKGLDLDSSLTMTMMTLACVIVRLRASDCETESM